MSPHRRIPLLIALCTGAAAAGPLDGLLQDYRSAAGALDPAAPWCWPYCSA